jgi:dUTPase
MLAGIIDEDYCGQMLVLGLNVSNCLISIKEHDKVAQLIVQPYNVDVPYRVSGNYSASLPPSSRNKQGFGVESTDKLIPKNSGEGPSYS